MGHGDNHNTEALRDVYVRSYDRLFSYGLTLVNNSELVHDAIQNLFLWLLKHPKVLHDINQLDLYLIKCVRRRVLAAAKSHNRKRELHRLYEANKLTVEASIEALLIENEQQEGTLQDLRESIQKLSSHQREVLYLRYFASLSYDEIAEIQSVSNQVVRNSVSRALKNLRKHFFAHIQYLILLCFLSY